MLLDRHLAIGKDHDICQDYTHIFTVGQINVSIVCDGCSASHYLEPTVDTGARIIALTAARHLKHMLYGKSKVAQFSDAELNVFITRVIADAQETAQKLDIQESSLFATLLVLISDGERSNVLMLGDGAVVYQRKGQSYLDAQSIEFSSHAPFYISYLLHDEDRQGYRDMFGAHPIYSTKYKILPEGCAETFLSQPEKIALDKKFDVTFYNQLNFMVEGELDYIVIMSDGIESFFDGVNKQSFETMAQKMLFCKNLQGRFIQRRMLKFASMNPDLQHGDDLSVAGITFAPQCKKPSIPPVEAV